MNTGKAVNFRFKPSSLGPIPEDWEVVRLGEVAELKQGRIEFRADKTGVIHLAVGKVSMESDHVKANIDTFIGELSKKRPSDVKGDFIKSASLSSTMGPGLKLQIQE